MTILETTFNCTICDKRWTVSGCRADYHAQLPAVVDAALLSYNLGWLVEIQGREYTVWCPDCAEKKAGNLLETKDYYTKQEVDALLQAMKLDLKNLNPDSTSRQVEARIKSVFIADPRTTELGVYWDTQEALIKIPTTKISMYLQQHGVGELSFLLGTSCWIEIEGTNISFVGFYRPPT
jgi:transcription elongation factor Elf1